MVRFAYDCIMKMRDVAKKLESQLGPDTTELSMRIGLNSGPVTAGVLRGDRARFQLFGDVSELHPPFQVTFLPLLDDSEYNLFSGFL
jgi:class 3 adenylate cyclase